MRSSVVCRLGRSFSYRPGACGPDTRFHARRRLEKTSAQGTDAKHCSCVPHPRSKTVAWISGRARAVAPPWAVCVRRTSRAAHL